MVQSEVIISIYLFIEKIQAILYLIMIIHKKKKKFIERFQAVFCLLYVSKKRDDLRLWSWIYLFIKQL